MRTDEGTGDAEAGPGAGARTPGAVDRAKPGTTGRVARLRSTAEAVAGLASETQISFLAAALAYYGFVSMVPLVVLGVAVATTLGGSALADRLVAVAGDFLAPAGEELLRSAVTVRTGLGGVTAVGLVVLLWGSLKAFRAFDVAFSLVYGTRPASSVLDAISDALVALSAVGVAVVAMAVVGTAVALLPGPFVGVVGAGTLFLTLVVAFLPLYYLFPDADLDVREALPGAVLAGLGWTVLGAGFRLYATYVSGASVYGLLGGVLLALTWLYLGALLLLLAAAVNAVRSGHAPAPDR